MSAEPLDRSIWSRARWLVLAPHPDDETLGAGSLIAHAAVRDRLAAVAYLTDGTGSHPAGTPRLSVIRRVEARRAVARLTKRPFPIDWIGWTDAHPPESGSPHFLRDATRLGSLLRRRRIDAIAVTDLTEGHCDHVAAHRLAEAAIRLAHRPIGLFSYHVWSTPSDHRARRIRTEPIAPGRRRHALRAHRTQLSNVLGEGFRLPPERCRMATTDVLTLQGRR